MNKYLPTADGVLPEQLQSASRTPSRPVVGIDLSLTGTGVTIIDSEIHTALFGAKGHKDDTLQMRAERLELLFAQIVNVIPENAFVVIEQPAYSRTQGSQHDRSGIWWLIVHHLYQFHDVVEVVPSTLKKYATGKGNASKDEVLAAVVRRYLDVNVTDNNVSDSLVLAAIGARFLGRPLEDELPTANLGAMTAIQWPNRKA